MLYDLLGLHSLYIEANHSGRKILVARCIEPNVLHPGESLLHLAVQFVYARRDSRGPDVLVKTNGRRQRPIMSKAWKPPGENQAALAGVCGECSCSHASNGSSEKKRGITGRIFCQTTGFAHTNPVPRGPNIHLWVPAANASHPRAVIFGSSTPKPCTPSTISSTRSFSSLPRFACAMLSAIRAIGRRTPLLECTHVTPTARVFGPIALRMRCAISSAEIEL